MMARLDKPATNGILLGSPDGDVVDLHGLTALHYLRRHPHAFGNRSDPIDALECTRVDLVGVVARPEAELFSRLVVLPDGAARRPRQLVRPHHNRLEYRLQIEGRAEGPPNLTERRQLAHR